MPHESTSAAAGFWLRRGDFIRRHDRGVIQAGFSKSGGFAHRGQTAASVPEPSPAAGGIAGLEIRVAASGQELAPNAVFTDAAWRGDVVL
jgi:hypothetical protein